MGVICPMYNVIIYRWHLLHRSSYRYKVSVCMVVVV